jgi:hypothetical protein
VLIHKLIIPHNKNKATKPEINDARCVCGMSMGMMKATMAMLHHGKYKHTRKLKRMMRIVQVRNFIFR